MYRGSLQTFRLRHVKIICRVHDCLMNFGLRGTLHVLIAHKVEQDVYTGCKLRIGNESL